MGFNKFYIAEALKWIKEINDENGDYSKGLALFQRVNPKICSKQQMSNYIII